MTKQQMILRYAELSFAKESGGESVTEKELAEMSDLLNRLRMSHEAVMREALNILIQKV